MNKDTDEQRHRGTRRAKTKTNKKRVVPGPTQQSGRAPGGGQNPSSYGLVQVSVGTAFVPGTVPLKPNVVVAFAPRTPL